jgi:hypothetical protein
MSLRIPGVIIAATVPSASVGSVPSLSERLELFGLEAVYKVAPDDCLFEGQVWGPPGFGGIHDFDLLLVRETLGQLDPSGRLVLIEAGRCAAPHDQAAYLGPLVEAFRLLAPRLASLISSFEEVDATINISLHVRGRVHHGRFRIGEASVLGSLEEGTVIALHLGLYPGPDEVVGLDWSDEDDPVQSHAAQHLRAEHPVEYQQARIIALSLVGQAFAALPVEISS